MHNLAHFAPLGKDIPPTKRGHERCVALLVSATELFLERGYDAVSLDDIVQHAGGSKASIYKYFGNKEGLFKAICDYRRDKFFQDIHIPFEQIDSNLRGYLIQTLLNFYHHILEPENAAFMRLVLEQSQRNPDIALHIHERGPLHVQLCIAKVLEHASQQGLICCEQPIYSAQLYFGILRNFEWRIIMGIPKQETEQETTNYVSYCVDRFLDAHQKA